MERVRIFSNKNRNIPMCVCEYEQTLLKIKYQYAAAAARASTVPHIARKRGGKQNRLMFDGETVF